MYDHIQYGNYQMLFLEGGAALPPPRYLAGM
jgi:hypothetical protein